MTRPLRAYLDHASATAVRPEVVEVVAGTMRRVGNPSSLHASGRAARRVVEEARESIAADLGVRPSDVVFTAGATEADNLGVLGLARGRHAVDPRRTRVLASAVEHHAVLDPVLWLGRATPSTVQWLPVDAAGRLDLAATRDAVEQDPGNVALVTVMWANNEVGTVQPIAELLDLLGGLDIPLHVDAVQGIGALPVVVLASVARVGSFAVSGHKLGGPVGVGALVVDPRLPLEPIVHGGGQERGVRSGTLDAAAVAGLALALRLAVQQQDDQAHRLAALRERLRSGVLAVAPDAVVNGHPEHHLPGILHVTFPGCDGDSVLMLLDAAGIEASTGSACSAGVPEPSHVLLAMGQDAELATASVRFSLGRTSTAAEVDAVIEALPGVLDRARRARRLSQALAAREV
jgi:cysteine desulfurase